MKSSAPFREGVSALEPKLPATSGWVSRRCVCSFDALLTKDAFDDFQSSLHHGPSARESQLVCYVSPLEHSMIWIVSEAYSSQAHFVKALIFVRDDDNTSLCPSHSLRGLWVPFPLPYECLEMESGCLQWLAMPETEATVPGCFPMRYPSFITAAKLYPAKCHGDTWYHWI